MIGANSTVAKYCAELKIADAVPRSFTGNQAATMRPLAGKEGDSDRPTMRRIRNSAETASGSPNSIWSMPMWCTLPCSIVNSDQSRMLQA